MSRSEIRTRIRKSGDHSITFVNSTTILAHRGRGEGRARVWKIRNGALTLAQA